jgi:hypothetical protein
MYLQRLAWVSTFIYNTCDFACKWITCERTVLLCSFPRTLLPCLLRSFRAKIQQTITCSLFYRHGLVSLLILHQDHFKLRLVRQWDGACHHSQLIKTRVRLPKKILKFHNRIEQIRWKSLCFASAIVWWLITTKVCENCLEWL